MSLQSTPPKSGRPPIAQHDTVYASILDLIGDTPLVKIALEAETPRATIWGKMESTNPGGSTKDRICLAMLTQAARDGSLKPGGIVVEPTSGNTGIGLALVCARLGYRCILTMPESMSLERRGLLKAMGAEIILTPAEEQMQGAIDKASEVAKELSAFIPRQFDNPANPEAHATGTAAEIIHAMQGLSIDVFVASIGTGGTISGVGEVFRREQPQCRIIGVEPEACATLSRNEVGPTKIQGLAPGFVPNNYKAEVVDEIRTVTDIDAFNTKRALAHGGLLVGISSGATLRVALDIAKTLPPEQNVIAILPDTGERYFSLDEYFN